MRLKEVKAYIVRIYQSRTDHRDPEATAYAIGVSIARLHLQAERGILLEADSLLEAANTRSDRLIHKVGYRKSQGLVGEYDRGLFDEHLADHQSEMDQKTAAGEMSPEAAIESMDQTRRYYGLVRALAHMGGLNEYRRTLAAA